MSGSGNVGVHVDHAIEEDPRKLAEFEAKIADRVLIDPAGGIRLAGVGSAWITVAFVAVVVALFALLALLLLLYPFAGPRSARRPTFSVRRSARAHESCTNSAQLWVRTSPYRRNPRSGSIPLLTTR